MMNYKTLFFTSSVALLASCSQSTAAPNVAESERLDTKPEITKTIVVAGGCFWCVESDFDKVDGVVATISGYSGGHVDNPTYKQVSREDTGHYEVVQIEYDPETVSFDELLTYYWRHVDPTDDGGQFCDRGDSYKTAIFVNDENEQQIALKSKSDLENSGVLEAPVVTPILTAAPFYPAETYHQNYYKKNPLRYRYYRSSCGRDKRIEQVWANETAHN